ncbi:MAG TPA: class I SAM-dependent methyltransferase [Opitutaceae bacterium]|jgi:SAM-dependent methyltransferase|nr:class I SAM-dependent methyltransferase [Opitutaceae bacterium]
MKSEVFSRYARCYDLLYRDKDYAGESRFVDGLLCQAGVQTGSILDVGCGTGAHARELARLGWKVTGVDLSTEMIDIARQRIPPGFEIEFSPGAAAEFNLGRTFCSVVSLFHVASYHVGPEDLFRMFVNVRRHLVSGGIFIFDFWHGPGVLADPPVSRIRRVEDDCIRVIRISEPVHRPERCAVDVNYEIQIEDIPGKTVECFRETHRMRYFFLPELEFMLGRAGFSVEALQAGLSEKKLDRHAWHGLIVARGL